MNNMELYNAVRQVPKTAIKPITAGHLKGKSDINPMWRIEKLTELFGPCGTGWKYVITDKQVLPGANGEVIAIVDVDLYYKQGDKWSEAVPGTGGNMLVNLFKGQLQTDDDGFKKALTDALSVAAKAIGVGADVYYERSETKYNKADMPTQKEGVSSFVDDPRTKNETEPPKCMICGQNIKVVRCQGRVYSAEDIRKNSLSTFHRELCWDCMKKERKKMATNAGNG